MIQTPLRHFLFSVLPLSITLGSWTRYGVPVPPEQQECGGTHVALNVSTLAALPWARCPPVDHPLLAGCFRPAEDDAYETDCRRCGEHPADLDFPRCCGTALEATLPRWVLGLVSAGLLEGAVLG